MTTPGYMFGVTFHENRYVPRGDVYATGPGRRTIVGHPLTLLRLRFPRSPVWSERTVGHREQERERRIRAKEARRGV